MVLGKDIWGKDIWGTTPWHARVFGELQTLKYARLSAHGLQYCFGA
jgi:hypothetical protein